MFRYEFDGRSSTSSRSRRSTDLDGQAVAELERLDPYLAGDVVGHGREHAP
jgi:hypothetical protein